MTYSPAGWEPPSLKGPPTFAELADHIDDVVTPVVREHFATCHGESGHSDAAEHIRAAVIAALLEKRLVPVAEWPEGAR